MLPQERLSSCLADLPDAAVYAFTDRDNDPVALSLRSQATEQGVVFFSYQDIDADLIDPLGVCYIGFGTWPPGSYNSRLQREVRSLACRVVGSCVPDAVFVFDATWRQDGGWQGKGGRAVPILMANGYKIQHAAAGPNDLTILRRSELFSSFRQAQQMATA